MNTFKQSPSAPQSPTRSNNMQGSGEEAVNEPLHPDRLPFETVTLTREQILLTLQHDPTFKTRLQEVGKAAEDKLITQEVAQYCLSKISALEDTLNVVKSIHHKQTFEVNYTDDFEACQVVQLLERIFAIETDVQILN